MSVLNTTFLNEAINEKNIVEVNEILNYVRMRLIATISSEGARDGMDCTLLCFNKKDPNHIKYSAANHRPILVKEDELIELKGDKMPVGNSDKLTSFTTHIIIKSSPSKNLFIY